MGDFVGSLGVGSGGGGGREKTEHKIQKGLQSGGGGLEPIRVNYEIPTRR